MQIKQGDIFKLGDHLLACGDATDPKLVKSLLGDKKINLLLTDPPYGVAYVESKQNFTQGSNHQIIENDQNQTEQEYINFTKAWLKPILENLTDYNSLYIFNSDKMLFALKKALDESKCKFSQLLIWVKNHAVVGRLDYLPQHELIAYGWFGKHKFIRSKDKSVIFYPRPHRSKLHPTMKPIGLLRKLILNSSNTGDYVLDPFLGSGSTLIACEQTKRKCLGIELDKKYCQTIIDRWENLTHQKAILKKEAHEK